MRANMNSQPPLAEIAEHIDSVFGKNFAQRHPDFVGRYLVAHAIREIDETLAQGIALISKTGPAGLLKFLTG